MPDNTQMPTLSPDEGLDSFRDALTAVASQHIAVVCYHDGDDPTKADPEWIAERQANNDFPDAAAVLVPITAWNEYATLRNQNTGVEAAELTLRLKREEQEFEQAALQPRRIAIELAIKSTDRYPNMTSAKLLQNADSIYQFLTTGAVPEGGPAS